MAGRTLVVQCTLADAHSGARIDAVDAVVEIDDDTETATIWMPDHGLSGRAYVLLDPGEKIAFQVSSDAQAPEDSGAAMLSGARSTPFGLER